MTPTASLRVVPLCSAGYASPIRTDSPVIPMPMPWLTRLFPDTDPRWRDADSMDLLARAHEAVRGRGYACRQADVTVIAEQPRLSGHAAAMAGNLAHCLGLAPDDISVKAKTNEGMGFVGRGEGLAVIAMAVVEAYPSNRS
jgi:2-C-methyl-D-erythritol 2,4-cyclodiphosphate synthase